MLKPKRTLVGIFVFLILVFSLPVPAVSHFKSHLYSLIKSPTSFSKGISNFLHDLFYFRKNAQENTQLRQSFSKIHFDKHQQEELILENQRLRKLLDLRKTTPSQVKSSIFARVIARSPSTWNRTFLIDKGTSQGIEVNMLVLSNFALAGKIVEVGPSASKVVLITDPNSKIGVLVQRTRDQGVLYGTLSGECRMKYIPLDTDAKVGDVVESAGLGGFLPRGLPVGTLEKLWKEPGQIYQVAKIKPMADLSRIEEVVCIR